MTGPALPIHRRAPPSAPSQSPDRKDFAAASASEPRSVVDAWRRKLRLHGERSEPMPQILQQQQPVSEPSAPRRKRSSFLKMLFKPELRAPAPPSARAAPLLPVRDPLSSNQASNDETKPRALLSASAARWQEPHGAVVTVGGRRVPFTLDAHRRQRKRRSLARIAESQPTQSSAEAYRRRAYYPAQAARSSKEKAAKQP